VIDEVFEEDFINRGYALFHASAVADGEGRGILLTSSSGVGKSTLALALVEKGYKFLSNDRALARVEDDHVHLVGVPKKPRINPGTILSLSSLNHIISDEDRHLYDAKSKSELWQIEHKYDADIDAIFGPGTFVLEALLSTVYVLNWKVDQHHPVVEILSEDAAADMIRPQILSLDMHRKQAIRSPEAEEQLQSICQIVPVYNVKGGVGMAELADMIQRRQGV
jgi:HprK-related kinase B